MPRTNKKPTLGTKKKFQALEKQANANEQEVQHVIREKEARKKLKACQKKGAITRPDGTAGRHFNLQHAMNLDDRDTVYKKIRYKIIEIAKDNGLCLETTIRYQPPMLLGTIITLAMLEIPYLTHFKDGWTVKDLLQQFLQNHTNYRRRMGYDAPSSNKITLSSHNKLTRTHTSTGCAKLPAPAAHSDSDDISETDPGSDEDSDSEEIGPGSEGGLPADIAELFKKRVEDFLKAKRAKEALQAPRTDPQVNKRPTTATKTRISGTSKVTRTSKKAETVAQQPRSSGETAMATTPPQVQAPSTSSSKTVSKIPLKPRPRPIKPEAKTSSESACRDVHEDIPTPHSGSQHSEDIPKFCPDDDCEDRVPTVLSIAEAHTIRLDSGSARIDLHPALDSDEELDQIYRTNIQRSKSNTRVAIHDNQSSKGRPPRLRRATVQLIEATLPQPGPSRHPNVMRSSSDCPSQECSTTTSRPPDSTLSRLTPLPPSPARKRRRRKTKAAVMPIEEGPITGPTFKRKRTRHH